MSSLEERFEAKVDRTGDHHLWTGSKKSDGTGKLKVDGKTVTARRVAWELLHGPLSPGVEVRACPADKACVRVEHLSLDGQVVAARPRRRAAPGEGSMIEIRPGVWKITVTRGRYDDGTPRREYLTVEADDEAEARRLKAAFITEIDTAPVAGRRDDRDITLDQAVEDYLDYLQDERGREARTLAGYRQVHNQWFKPEIGQRRLRDLDHDSFEKILGKMRRAGLSRSRMNNAQSLYKPLFQWAKRKRIVRRNPIADLELPKSTYISRQRRPPEVDQLCWLLTAALDVIPDVAPVLTLGATTGMRRGELVVPRRHQLHPGRGELLVDTAADLVGTKETKTGTERVVTLDAGTVDMLLRHIAQMDQRAAAHGIHIAPDAYIFSLEIDCSKPMPADHVTKRVAVLKEHLGIADKRPATIALENQALALFRGEPQPRPQGQRGPPPKGAMSYDEIGRRLGHTGRWAAKAIASAQRREQAGSLSYFDTFDGSILGLRKFTSSELLDAGFNISAVAQRQGHGPQVLAKHYSKSRRSADRKAAEHLGRLIHPARQPSAGADAPSL